MILTIDAGTTNLRLKLYRNKEDKEPIDSRKFPFGVSIGKEIFIKNLENAVTEFLDSNKIKTKNVMIVAAGMITSQLGLYFIDHLETPVSKRDLKNNITSINFLDTQIHLVTGIKHRVSQDNLTFFDVMRGEEVEIIGVLEEIQNQENLLLIMPGSHNKIVEIDSNNQIKGFRSTLSGELLSVLKNNTILKNSLEEYPKKISEEYLLLGYKNSKKQGLTKSSFALRCLSMYNNLTLEEKFSYLLGVVLQEDVNAIQDQLKDTDKNILVLGNSIISRGLTFLLSKKLTTLSIKNLISDDMSARGILNLI